MSDPRLLYLLEDSETVKALSKFFEDQANDHRKIAAELMGADNSKPELARKYACIAEAYDKAMGRLREYAKQV